MSKQKDRVTEDIENLRDDIAAVRVPRRVGVATAENRLLEAARRDLRAAVASLEQRRGELLSKPVAPPSREEAAAETLLMLARGQRPAEIPAAGAGSEAWEALCALAAEHADCVRRLDALQAQAGAEGTRKKLAGENFALVGPAGLLKEDEDGALAEGNFDEAFRQTPVNTIYGGTVEILRSLIAEVELGLPKSR